MKNTLYNKMLMAAAQYEIGQLKKSGQEFVLDKGKFNPNSGNTCFYGQVFGSSSGKKAMDFKRENDIPVGFGRMAYYYESSCTALEKLTYTLWMNGEKQRVYKIVEQFVTWKSEPIVQDDSLFTLED